MATPATAGELTEFEAVLVRTAHSAGYDVAAAGAAVAATPGDLEEATCRARFAADLSSTRASDKAFLRWEDLGSWRLLYGRPLNSATVQAISDDAARLLRQGSPEHWKTVLAYLDAGRRAETACEALTIHRATLYYRLNRVRELLGADALDDGWRAASLHVALKLHGHLVGSRI